jgi:hypothetical protein
MRSILSGRSATTIRASARNPRKGNMPGMKGISLSSFQPEGWGRLKKEVIREVS